MQIYVYVYREKHSAGGIWLSSARVRKDDEVQAVFWFPTGSNQSVCGGGVLLLNLQRKRLSMAVFDMYSYSLVYKNMRKSRLAWHGIKPKENGMEDGECDVEKRRRMAFWNGGEGA